MNLALHEVIDWIRQIKYRLSKFTKGPRHLSEENYIAITCTMDELEDKETYKKGKETATDLIPTHPNLPTSLNMSQQPVKTYTSTLSHCPKPTPHCMICNAHTHETSAHDAVQQSADHQEAIQHGTKVKSKGLPTAKKPQHFRHNQMDSQVALSSRTPHPLPNKLTTTKLRSKQQNCYPTRHQHKCGQTSGTCPKCVKTHHCSHPHKCGKEPGFCTKCAPDNGEDFDDGELQTPGEIFSDEFYSNTDF